MSSKWRHAPRQKWQWCFQKVIAPCLRRSARLLLRWSSATAESSASSDTWKQQALEDFGTWLEALPAVETSGDPGPQACDLYTLLLEFAALRQEIKLQSRQQRTTLRTQENLSDQLQALVAQFDQRIARLDQVQEHTWRRKIEDAAVLPFLDVRDALIRGMMAARRVAQTRSFWRRPPLGMDAVVEGYAMSLRRFDRSLDRLGIRPIQTIGRPFDATRMRAVEKRSVADQQPGIVLEETLSGFLRGDGVLRTAEVVVSGR